MKKATTEVVAWFVGTRGAPQAVMLQRASSLR